MQEKNDTQVYEIGFHILPSVEEGRLQEAVVRLKDILAKHGGVIISEDFPKLRQLAYTMQKEVQGKLSKFNKAYFGSIKFEVEGEKVTEIAKALQNDADILRSILVKTVRENTVYYSKNMEAVKEENNDKPAEPAKEMSAEEIDKSIEELVIN